MNKKKKLRVLSVKIVLQLLATKATKNVTILPVSYNDKYVKELIGQVVSFWKLNIFPKLYESVTM